VSDLETIPERLAAVRALIHDAVHRAGRPQDAVRLIAVSKTKPAEAIRIAYAAGQRDFGENYVQELVDKAAELADLPDIRWHFIGSLQRNKAKPATNLAAMIHTVDRDELLDEIEKRAKSLGKVIDVLIEVNVGDEASKTGASPETLALLLAKAKQAKNIRVRGLMAIPPFLDDPEAVRPYFAKLRQLRDTHGGSAALPELSMGMSHDCAVAIAEGATLVRVGTAIFGSR
jgi:pyridoxal phosphate enzyme (YggS family)